jgi:hypothetical protein
VIRLLFSLAEMVGLIGNMFVEYRLRTLFCDFLYNLFEENFFGRSNICYQELNVYFVKHFSCNVIPYHVLMIPEVF